MKVYRVTFHNGEVWDIPAELIARQRAEYYAEHDVGNTDSKEYREAVEAEIKYALEEDTNEIQDWARGNTNWVDVRPYARQVRAPKPTDYPHSWVNPLATEVVDLDDEGEGGD